MDPIVRLRQILGIEDGVTEVTAEHLAGLNADELAEAQTLMARIGSEAGELEPTSEVLDVLNEVVGYVDAVRTEATRREAEAAANEAAAQAALARINGTAAAGPDDEGSTEETDTEGETPAGDAEPETVAETVEAEPVLEPVAASARPSLRDLARRAPARTRPVHQATQQEATPVAGRIEYTSGLTGRTLETRGDVVDTLARTIRQASSKPGVTVAVSGVRDFPEERRLLSQAPERNDALVAAAVDGGAAQLDALVAAGGLCAPIENLYNVEVVGVTSRPIKDALAPFSADRGGVSLRQGPYFGDYASATGIWTNTNDQNNANAVGSPPPSKSKMIATCPGFTDFEVQAIYTRVEFRNVTSRFDPEGTAANLSAIEIARARMTENALLGQIAAQSVTLTSPKVLGAARDLLAGLDRLIGWWRNRFRTDETVTLEAFMPIWARDMIRADITRGEYDLDAFAVANAQIDQFFIRRGVMPVWHLDGNTNATTSPAVVAQSYGAQTAAAALLEFPDQVEVLLHPAGSFLFLDGGTLDLGVVRDTTSNTNNSYEVFMEDWEYAAFRGTPGQSIRYAATVDPTGMSAGRLDTSAISD